MSLHHSGNQLIDPYLLFEKAQLRAGMHIADLGCGRTGHIIFPASAIIGDRGIIYAVDILKDVLDNIKRRAAEESLLNVQPIWADLEKVGYTAIPKNSLDVGFIINSLVQSHDRVSFLNESLRLLKDKARLIIVDWVAELPFSPKIENFINFEEIINWGRGNNLAIQEEFEAGKYHRGVVLYKHE